MSEQILVSPNSKSDTALRWISRIMVATVWTSALLFGLFILSFYFVALLKGNTEQWNEILPGLYDTRTGSATIGIGIHFAAGGIILVLGCIQLLRQVREKYPALHRWLGRLYVTASLLTALGGLVFIFVKGTIGGTVMDIGFAGYGILMFLAAVETIRHARAGRMERHRAWAIRLFALAIGSWLYRMDYGFWILFTDGLWHTDTFTGGFDYFMDFFFYLPNLVVAEFFIRRQRLVQQPVLKWLAASGMVVATAFLILATYFFTLHYWGPAIVELFTGA
ncbi:DUF2306 domain-containing protein [Flavilitoribacter nigricans]|uniref:DUF2306 domain-containing protein n=1 Tax=Flavilitoribacter nigricans (strain ATCC 23147 / DSM 23189 / NBRC 102662 / NCIMB 1420 / SS-2) TaxID=1122177 RepID=A0A2D0MY90_FLAN2|nr:DUF2306 domain-containing protein [Flavilitoribacter nigricans]PHN01096.1 hypothetical protein CRP01_38815 [Flavilitoribacter nigricans DSM 23189 = NBRC 102662]